MYNVPHYRFIFIVVIILFTLIRCAQVVQPNGGKKDTKSPVAVKYKPDSAQTNFQGKNISILFDEYIQLGNLQKELIISPPMKIAPEVTAKGKLLTIEIKDTLKKNVTYAINFGNAIHDITEQNVSSNFEYVFSTGTQIDTLTLSGIVKDAFTLKPQKEILVMLYDVTNIPSSIDSLPSKRLPSYYSKTKDDGMYKIQHIKAGTYKLFALKDANENYLFDVSTESVAFSDTLLKISKNKTSELLLFNEEPAKQKLLKSNAAGKGCLLLVYTKPVSSLSYKPLNAQTKTETFLEEYNKARDSIHIWYPDVLIDSLQFIATIKEGMSDTIKVRTSRPPKEIAGRGDILKLILATNIKKDSPFDLNKNLELKFSHPIKSFKTSSIVFKNDTTDLSNLFNNIKFTDDKLKKDATIDFPKKQEATSYSLFIPPGSFTDIFGLTNDTIKINFKTNEEKFYGAMKIKVKMKYKAKYILQLIHENGNIIDYYNSENGIFSYSYLTPGNYNVRVIYDSNGDDKWSPGNYYSNIKPEKLIYYPNPITIRANWEQEIEWDIE